MNMIKKILLNIFGDGFFGLERDQNTQEEDENKILNLDEPLPDYSNEKPSDVPHFPPDTVNDFTGTVSDETSQNLRQKLLNLNAPQKARLALLANRPTRSLLIQSPVKMISLAVFKNPKLTESEVLSFAQQKNLSEDVILAIAKHQKWIKIYQIKLAVVSNPKTPLSVAINFLSHLHEKDLKSLSRDKSISSVLGRAAYQTLLKRNYKG